ncbi:MAG: 4-hydroxy-3-methylbut-2-enyl diphosphate reductase [Erysipelotrichaceae bacterium]|nr:4-hydroxy-3-methylbut-2-enyl diphosphate reductase [Erysipelotrichaceae bacterium]
MEICEVKPSGYCKGVGYALAMVKKAVWDYPDQPVYIVGMLVHNRYIVDALKTRNVITLDDSSKSKMELVESIESGVVVFTAHGIADSVKNRAIEKGLTVVDATCEFVRKTHQIIRDYLNRGYSIFYIGKKKHPESEAALSINESIILITDADDVDKINNTDKNILVTTQTTMSINDTADIIRKIRKRFPHAEIAEEICDATRRRQNAVRNLKDTDVLIVVGDPKSNNTLQLARMGSSAGIRKVLRIETARDLVNVKFSENDRIAVASGASTPKVLLDNVIAYLQTHDASYLQTDLETIVSFL